MEMKEVFYLVALVVFALGCRTFANRFIFKLGWYSLLVASYLLGWFLTRSHWVGVLGVSIWFLLPWLEVVARVRTLRFPRQSVVKQRFAPSQQVFPDLPEITEEIEAAGFESVEDVGWKWQEMDHYLRLFYHSEKRMQATVVLMTHDEVAFSYVTMTSRTEDGRTFSTSNYPFSPMMRTLPEQSVRRCPDVSYFEEMILAHEAHLAESGLQATETMELLEDQMRAQIEADLQRQIDFNLTRGTIENTDGGTLRYSWRGCFFVYFQIVKDMLRV
jgi:hypothetical protein